MNIVPESKQPPRRSWLIDALIGGAVGAVIATVAWLISGDPTWFYAIPVIALLAELSPGYRPRVVRTRRDGE